MRVKKTLQILMVTIVVVIIIVQFVGPARSNPVSATTQSFESFLQVPPHVARILERSCSDCHSNHTRWPWYSHVAPVSWFVIDHVNHARSHLNFSEWGRYTQAERDDLLHQICMETKSGTMPLKSYTTIHKGAKLVGGDVKMLCEWASSQRKGSGQSEDR